MKIILIIAVILGFVAAALAWPLFICGVREHDYGVNTKWTLLNGCMIETKPGVFVPEEHYRGTVD